DSTPLTLGTAPVPSGIWFVPSGTGLVTIGLHFFLLFFIQYALRYCTYVVGVYLAVLALTSRLLEAEPERVGVVIGMDGCLLTHSEYCKLFLGRRWIRAANDLMDICVLVGGACQTLWALLGRFLCWWYMCCIGKLKAVGWSTTFAAAPVMPQPWPTAVSRVVQA
ncbi:MAG: hypothetical protein ACKPKO_27480, partial [Candidatus Fonsibacter sp.]